MFRSRTTLALCALVATAGSFSEASADTAEANCVLRKDGETKQGASGPCTFSQRQGHVDIDLRNGTHFSLEPLDAPHHFRDQEGKKVVRTASGDSHEYKWEGKKVIVTFPADTRPGAAGGHHGAGHGDAPANLRDLPGGRFVGGEVDDEMARRGYRHARNRQADGETWSYWRSAADDACVVVHLDEKRRVASVVNAPPGDCK